MILALELSKKLNILEDHSLIQRMKKMLESIGLPTEIPPDLNRGEIVDLMLKDKKKTTSKDEI
jgi:3-dehydroquinate synthetase